MSTKAVRAALLTWFSGHQRDLPWRHTKDAYAIWLSEVMLQQTQVDRVVGYWQRFLTRFPTLSSLAGATEQEVLGLWSGLGYYSRARNLHRAAREMVEHHGGRVPRDLEALRALPGFGRYTSGAVASIAYGVEAPVVDGNVARVLSRLYLVEGSPQDKEREKRLWALADELVRGKCPGDLNQALMELGATVCVPGTPRCQGCPVSAWCGARKAGRQQELPPPKKRPLRRVVQLQVAFSERRGALYLARRSARGLFGGLWELPSVEVGAEALSTLLGPSAIIGEELAVVRRTLTHRELVMSVVAVGGRPALREGAYVEARWLGQAELDLLGISSGMRAVIAAAREAQRGAS